MVPSKICLLLVFLAPVAVSTNTWHQDPYKVPSSLSDNLALKSTINLSSIGDSEYTALAHPRFPNHRVRIKKSNFCDPTVKLAFVYCHLPAFTLTISLFAAFIQVTLMFDAGAKHLFFYFFESRRDPEKGIQLFMFKVRS